MITLAGTKQDTQSPIDIRVQTLSVIVSLTLQDVVLESSTDSMPLFTLIKSETSQNGYGASWVSVDRTRWKSVKNSAYKTSQDDT